MRNHLSQDQLSMCILGRATPEEECHGRECPQCRAELGRFFEPVSAFRTAMHDWSDREGIPCTQEVSTFLLRTKRFSPVWRWVPASLAVLLLTGVPIYQQQQRLEVEQARIQAEESARQDALLMNAVTAHLSRTLPAPMEPIMALVPEEALATDSGGNE